MKRRLLWIVSEYPTPARGLRRGNSAALRPTTFTDSILSFPHIPQHQEFKHLHRRFPPNFPQKSTAKLQAILCWLESTIPAARLLHH